MIIYVAVQITFLRFISVLASAICVSISLAATGQSSNASTPITNRDNKYRPSNIIANIGANGMTISMMDGGGAIFVVVAMVVMMLFLFIKQYNHDARKATPYDKNT